MIICDAPISARDRSKTRQRGAKELLELRTFGRSFVGLGHLKHELDPHYTPTSAWKGPKDSIMIQRTERLRLDHARVNGLKDDRKLQLARFL